MASRAGLLAGFLFSRPVPQRPSQRVKSGFTYFYDFASMSYDLMVFDPNAAPAKKRAPFIDWYDQQTEWEEGHAYDDPIVSTPALRAFHADIIQAFPAQQEDDGPGTDYTIGKSVIYMTFGWDDIDTVHESVSRLAAKHGLGFFDVSSDLAETWLPDAKGGLYIAHSD